MQEQNIKMEIKPYKKLPLLKFFQHDLERIKMAFRLSDSIRRDVNNIRAAGDQVELAIKTFFQEKLQPKYHICDGHIIDSNLKVSSQFDLIIAENSKNPVLFNLADKSELIYFEPVFAFAEVKRSFYNQKLVEDFSVNIKRFNKELIRKEIPPNYIETGNSGIQVDDTLTNLPKRNPILKFQFFIDGDQLNLNNLGFFLSSTHSSNLPNFIVFLNVGVVVNINKKAYDSGKLRINLYPEFEIEENIWVLLDLDNENNVLIYQYLLVIEHLNSTIVGTPEISAYTSQLFDHSFSNIHKL